MMRSNSNGGRNALHRIFLRTLSHGYIEFSLDGANSHDIFMAFLKAHLPPDRIPQRRGPDSRGKPQAGGTALRTMVLTPTKDVPSSALPPAPPSPASSRQPRTLPRPGLTRSSSTMGSTNTNIDKLQSKAIKQRIRNESTPMQRAKERVGEWMSSLMDCACCQDTTVAPVEGTEDYGRRRGARSPTGAGKRGAKAVAGGGRSPNSTLLKHKGIGGLSFEEASCGPRLSFERSVGGDSRSAGKR